MRKCPSCSSDVCATTQGFSGGTAALRARCHQRCLTPRSSGATTACHQAPATGTVYIFCGRGLASCRRRPLSSNVRQRRTTCSVRRQSQRLSARIEQPRCGKAAKTECPLQACQASDARRVRTSEDLTPTIYSFSDESLMSEQTAAATRPRSAISTPS